MSYNYKKNAKYRQKVEYRTKKSARNNFLEYDVPTNQTLSCSLKTIKIFDCVFSSNNIWELNDAHYCDTVKRYQKPTKRAKIKTHEYSTKPG